MGTPIHTTAVLTRSGRLRAAILVYAAMGAAVADVRADILHVDDDASGRADGTSWAHAFTELQSALLAADPGDDIWVAAGRYAPDYDPQSGRHTGDREAAFVLPPGVAVYGGFDGTETTLDDRAGLFSSTLLTGDLGNDDDLGVVGDNSLHVVYAEDLGPDTILDGFTVASGFADGFGIPAGAGGGLLLLSAGPRIVNCRFVDNLAELLGGAVAGFSSPATFVNCTFLRNITAGRGGGIHGQTASTIRIEGCRFYDNVADRGGAVSGVASDLTLVNCVLVGNGAGVGAGLHTSQMSTPRIVNCIFAGNEAVTGGGLASFGSEVEVVGCLFAGNVAVFSAAVDLAKPTAPSVIACTIVDNMAFETVGGLGNTGASPVISNTLLWGNRDGGGVGSDESAQIADLAKGISDVTHCLIQGLDSLAEGIGNIDGDPLLESRTAGTWSAMPEYDQATGMTTFVDAKAAWTPGAAVGALLNPDDTQTLQSVVVANDRSSVTVLGDFATLGHAGAAYELTDYRPQPRSPAVDAGNNAALPPDVADTDGDGDTLEALPLDLAGLPRRADVPATVDCPQDPGSCGPAPVVDIGAYEVVDLPPEGGVVASTPPDGAIDARQPTDLDGTNPTGWDAVTLTFSGDPSALDAEAFELVAVGGTAPAIVDVSIAGSAATVHFDGPIPVGACTALRHPASGAAVRLGYLPADVSADGTSGPLDILALIDGLNGVTELPAWSCDIDRAGSCTPLDILRLIDLLNGAAAFDVWNGADLPDCP